ncbi:hypothetical protein [Pseudomonas sp. GV071]|jgi:hypothetical protein|uniref:hypothetical protein n=1 Tax=Pseudomonas sp. GV071 TaxID=2135754 RepID=UPI000D39F225|nr:hypothetical protein [Pseudomonas sp. GV071]PTQ66763.1 hypothetical protein C8K61_11935 [Pseudomonas sp. GV071]
MRASLFKNRTTGKEVYAKVGVELSALPKEARDYLGTGEITSGTTQYHMGDTWMGGPDITQLMLDLKTKGFHAHTVVMPKG